LILKKYKHCYFSIAYFPSDGDKQEQYHYALLGSSHCRCPVTEDQISKTYCELGLRFHPDKHFYRLMFKKNEAVKQAKMDEIETSLMAISKAYSVLIDAIRRKKKVFILLSILGVIVSEPIQK
jgi:hypothetical protein